MARKARVAERSGSWADHLGSIAALKIVGSLLPAERRLTTGTISDGVLADEDYVEVLKIGSFSAEDVQEARVSAADAAVETRIGVELREGRTPRAEEIEWRQQRRAAFAALRAAGVPIRVVATTGRVRSS
jgi:hypothetical protein